MKKRQFIMSIETNSEDEIKKIVPWAKYIVKDNDDFTSGWFCFERTIDFNHFNKLRKDNPNLYGWGDASSYPE